MAALMRMQILLVLILSSFGSLAETELKGKALHMALVETAYQYDFFNLRCRGVSVAKNEAKVNRLFLEKYQMTLNNFVNREWQKDPTEVEIEIKNTLQEIIFKLGGCQQAREKGLERQLKKDFRHQYDLAEQSAWFPGAY